MENNFSIFVKQVTQKLLEHLGEDYQIESKQAYDINDVMKYSLMLVKTGSNIYPCVNMDTYYNLHQSGIDLDTLVGEILDSCKEDSPVNMSAISDFTDWDNVKSHIYAKLISTEKNHSLLSSIPNRAYLDLSIVYYVRMESFFNDKYAVVQISNEHMEYWGVNEDMVYQSAWKNLTEPDETVVKDMADILNPLFFMKQIYPAGNGEDTPMYVLSNRYYINGAVQMCDYGALQEAAKMLESDLWILPSSVHEVILLPVCQSEDCAQGLADIVKEINDTQLEPQEILSYHVYHYSRKSGETTIAV